ncbi:MAG: hypothetical protein EOP93_15115 [Lysobacteraceae bacterium]|nr:MAG: hypothetical protein EOP93_15115 [Xanthomonadaceae bacterium]
MGNDALGLFLGRTHGGLVDVLRAHRGVGQHGHDRRLHLEDAAADREVELFAARQGDDHLPEQAFYMVGSIDEAVEKAKKLAA